VKALLDDWEFKGAYNIYPGTAHAALYAIWRLFEQTPSSIPDLTASRSFDLSLISGAPCRRAWGLLAMIALLERAAFFFGWHADSGPGAELGATVNHLNQEMARLGAIP
jgi:hypothetical protein